MISALVSSSFGQTTVSCSALKHAFKTATLTDQSTGCCGKTKSGVVDASSCVASTDDVASLKEEVKTLRQDTLVSLSEAGLPMSEHFRTVVGDITATAKSSLFLKTFYDPSVHPSDTNATLARVRLTDAWSKDRPFSTQKNTFIGPKAINGFLNRQEFEEFDVFVEDGYTWVQPVYTEKMRAEYDALTEHLGFDPTTAWSRGTNGMTGPTARYGIGYTYSAGARVDLKEDGKTSIVSSALPDDAGGKRYMELTMRVSMPHLSKEFATDTDMLFMEVLASVDASKYAPPNPKDAPSSMNATACHTTEEYGTRCYLTGQRDGRADLVGSNGGWGTTLEEPADFTVAAHRVREIEETFVKYTPRMYVRDMVYPPNLICGSPGAGETPVAKTVQVDGQDVVVHVCPDGSWLWDDAWWARFIGRDDLYLMRGGADSKAPYQSEVKFLYDTDADDKTHGPYSVSAMFDGVPNCFQASYGAGGTTPGYHLFGGKKALLPDGSIVDVKENLNLPECTGDSFYKAPMSEGHLPKLVNMMRSANYIKDEPFTTLGDMRWETFDALPHRWTTDGIRAAKMASPVPVHKEEIVPTSYPSANPPMLQTYPPGVFRGSESDLANHVTKRVHILPVTVDGEDRTAAVSVYQPVEDGSDTDLLLYLYHAEGIADDRDSDNNYMHQLALSMDMPVVAFRPPGTNTFDGPTRRVRYDGWVGSALRTLGMDKRTVHILCYTRGCSGAEMMLKNGDMEGIRVKNAYYGAAVVSGPQDTVPYFKGGYPGMYLHDSERTLRERLDNVYDAVQQDGTRYVTAGTDDVGGVVQEVLYSIVYELTFGNFWEEMNSQFRSLFTGSGSGTVNAWKGALPTFEGGGHDAAKLSIESMFVNPTTSKPSYPNYGILSGRPETTVVTLSPDDTISVPILRKHTRGPGASNPDSPSVEDVPGAVLMMSPSLPESLRAKGHLAGIHWASRAMHRSEESVLKEGSVTPWYGETLLDAKVNTMVTEYGLDRSRLVFTLLAGIMFAYDTPTVAEWDAYVAGNMPSPPVTMYSLHVQKNAEKFLPTPGHVFPEWQIKDDAGQGFDAPNTVKPRLMTNVHTHIASQIKDHFLERGYNLTQILDGSDNVLYAESLKTTSLSGTNPRGYAMLTVLGENAVQTYAYVIFNASLPIPRQEDTNVYFSSGAITQMFQRPSTQNDNAHAYPYHASNNLVSLFSHPEMRERGFLPNGKTIYMHTQASVDAMEAVSYLSDMYSSIPGADMDYHEVGNLIYFRVQSSVLKKASTIHPEYSSKYKKSTIQLWGINHPGTSRYGDTCTTLNTDYCGEDSDGFKAFTNPFLPNSVCTSSDRSGCVLSSGQACPLTCMRSGINHPGTSRYSDTCATLNTDYCGEDSDGLKTFTNPFLPNSVCTSSDRSGCALSSGQACPQTCGRAGFNHPGTDRFGSTCATVNTEYCQPDSTFLVMTNPFLPDTVCTSSDRIGCALNTYQACPQTCGAVA